MSKYRFEPNDLGRDHFNLRGSCEGRRPHGILRDALGAEAYRRHALQINFAGGSSAVSVEALMNPGLENGPLQFEVIGTVFRI